jgi:hypothetical protein
VRAAQDADVPVYSSRKLQSSRDSRC